MTEIYDAVVERALREIDATRAVVEALAPLDEIRRLRVLAAVAVLHGLTGLGSAVLDRITEMEEAELEASEK